MTSGVRHHRLRVRAVVAVVACWIGVVHADPETALRHYESGKKAEDAGDYAEAIQWYERARSIWSRDGQLYVPGEAVRWVPGPRGMIRETRPEPGTRHEYTPGARIETLEQRVAQAERAERERETEEARRAKFAEPPRLIVSAQRAETGVIRAGESGRILVTVRNDGRSGAESVTLHIDHDQPGLELDRRIPIGDIDPFDSRVHAVSYRSTRALRDGSVELEIKALEKDGFDASPAMLAARTEGVREPDLAIVQSGVERADGHLLQVSYELRNAGNGAAEDVRMSVDLDRRTLMADEGNLNESIETLAPGASHIVRFGVYTSIQAGEELPMQVAVRERRERYGVRTQVTAHIPPEGTPGRGLASTGRSSPVPAFTGGVDLTAGLRAGSHQEEHGFALVIGNGNYTEIDPVAFAHRDAETVAHYLNRTMGYREQDVDLRLDMSAREFRRVFGTRGRDFQDGDLYRRVSLNSRRRDNPPVFIYYSGHGAPSLQDGAAYMVPSDAELRYLEDDGLLLDDFYDAIAALPSDNVTIVVDSCFSGNTQEGMLYPDISPAMLQVADTIAPVDAGGKTIFTSTAPSQVSYWHTEAGYSLFTYYFLKGLSGEADANGDGLVTSGELQDYLSWNVEDHILRTQRPGDQTPQLVGETGRVMARFE